MYYFILTPNCLFKLFDNNNCKKKKQNKKKLFSRTNLSKRKSVCNYIFRVPLVDDRRRTFIHSSSKNAFNSSWCNLMGCPNNNNINLAGTPIDTTMCDNVQIGNLLDDLMELNFLKPKLEHVQNQLKPQQRQPSIRDDADGHLIYHNGDILQNRCSWILWLSFFSLN